MSSAVGNDSLDTIGNCSIRFVVVVNMTRAFFSTRFDANANDTGAGCDITRKGSGVALIQR